MERHIAGWGTNKALLKVTSTKRGVRHEDQEDDFFAKVESVLLHRCTLHSVDFQQAKSTGI
jgi:hypothetical protein